MDTSFLTSVIQKYYPETAQKIQTLIESNVVLEKIGTKAYRILELSVQKYADISERIKTMTRMLQAWQKGEYRDISYSTIFLSAAILLYFISPIDLIPDFIPFIGRLDDTILLAFLLKAIDKEIERFISWEREQSVQKA